MTVYGDNDGMERNDDEESEIACSNNDETSNFKKDNGIEREENEECEIVTSDSDETASVTMTTMAWRGT